MTLATVQTSAEDRMVCPFCPLHCDDLDARAAVSELPCPKARAGFGAALASSATAVSPRVRGEAAGSEEALDEAARILARARRPLITGMAGDVAAIRVAMDVAERAGAVVDHLHGDAMVRALSVLQGSGWSTSCLHEIRQRADLVVLVGRDLDTRYPRLLERVLDAGPGLFTGEHRLIVLDEHPLSREGAAHLPCPLAELGSLASTLHALLRDRPVASSPVPGLTLDALKRFVDALLEARYAVFIISPGLLDFPHADLALDALASFVQAMNDHSRCTLVNLAGGEGDTGTWQVSTWKSGFPVRVDFSPGAPVYDPHLHGTRRLLADGCDALLWLSAFEARGAPGAEGVQRVVIGHPDTPLDGGEAVFIPVGMPGIDHDGHLFRGDGTGLIPLRGIRTARLPAAAEVLRGLLERLTAGERGC